MRRGQQMRDRGAYGCSVPWSTPIVIQRPVVDGNGREWVRWCRCGKPHPPHIACSCRPRRPHRLLTHYPTPL